MWRGDHSFLVSLVASLLLHALILASLIQRMRQPSAVFLPPLARSPSIFMDTRDASMEFGATDGHGAAANAAPGELPMVGRDADQTQAFLSRDPVGPGHVGDDPSMSVLPRFVSPAPPSPGKIAEHIGAAQPAADLAPPQTRPPIPVARHGQDATAIVRTKNSPVPLADAKSGGGSMGSTPPAADPAIMSDSESDPFAPGMNVEFRDGKVDARLGRKVKTVRPHLSLAATIDLQSTVDPSMRVRVHIDTNGVVARVEILKSSGSAGADQAVTVALYQWWFEPKKDAAGRTVESDLAFPIIWR